MKREEIVRRIEELENRIFILAMKDMWSQDDFATDRKWHNEKRELEQQLEETDKGE